MIIQRKLEELKKSTVTIYVTGVTGMITTKGEHLQFPISRLHSLGLYLTLISLSVPKVLQYCVTGHPKVTIYSFCTSVCLSKFCTQVSLIVSV